MSRILRVGERAAHSSAACRAGFVEGVRLARPSARGGSGADAGGPTVGETDCPGVADARTCVPAPGYRGTGIATVTLGPVSSRPVSRYSTVTPARPPGRSPNRLLDAAAKLTP